MTFSLLNLHMTFFPVFDIGRTFIVPNLELFCPKVPNYLDNKAKRFANHTADQCYQYFLASICFCFRAERNAEAEQSDHQEVKEKLQCSLVNCLWWSAVKIDSEKIAGF